MTKMNAIMHSIIRICIALLRTQIKDELKKTELKKRRRWKCMYTRKWITRRIQLGFANGLKEELVLEESNDFRDAIRMI